MIAKNKVVYVPPVYEDVQHEVTSVDENDNPLRTSFHTDISFSGFVIVLSFTIVKFF